MNMADVFAAMVLLVLLILVGKVVRSYVPWLARIYMPSSLVGGALALLLGPQVIGRLWQWLVDGDGVLAQGIWPQAVLEVWSTLPGWLINVVFAGLFLGKTIARPGQIWKRAGPMVMHGQTMAWGQYVVGLTLVILLLTPVWGANPMAGALIEIGFEGGHGTAAGLADTFAELGFADGADLALGLATLGVVAGVLLGTLLINWAVYFGHIPRPDKQDDADQGEEQQELADHDRRETTRKPSSLRDRAIDPLSIHLGLIGLAIALGWLLQQGLILLESQVLLDLGWPELLRHIPMFPLAMLGGVAVQVAASRMGLARRIDRQLVNRISGTSLDLLIVSALATLSLAAIGANIWIFVILAAGGIAWNLLGLLVLARLMFPRDWVPNGLANFGQGMGMTVVGLLLVRMADPGGKTNTMEAFGYKQLLFEPVVGGGLFTAASLPLIVQFGPLPVLIFCTVVMSGWLICGLWLLKPKPDDGDDITDDVAYEKCKTIAPRRNRDATDRSDA